MIPSSLNNPPEIQSLIAAFHGTYYMNSIIEKEYEEATKESNQKQEKTQ